MSTSLRMGLPACVCSLLLLVASGRPSLVRADDARANPWRDTLWVTGSGALLGATLAGVFALQGSALRERAQTLWSNDPELSSLSRDAHQADALAIGFGVGAGLLTLASVLLLVGGSDALAAPSGRAEASALTPIVGPRSAALVWQGTLP